MSRFNLTNAHKYALYISAKAAGSKVSFVEKEILRPRGRSDNNSFLVTFTVDGKSYQMNIRYRVYKTGKWPDSITTKNLTEKRKIVKKSEFFLIQDSIANPKEAKVIPITKAAPIAEKKARISLREILGEDFPMHKDKKASQS